jgi:tetratricopeptide (TPR) repeat protein
MGGIEVPGPVRVTNEVDANGLVGLLLQAGSIGSVHLPSVSPPPVRVPRQLPPPPDGFVNRTRELATLHDLVSGDGAGEGPRVVVVSGLGGVGKTGLGLAWAARVADRFDGGQLYADLGAWRHGGGVEVGDVVGGFLRALGVREEWIPQDLAGRSALFRSMVADRRMLVFLDNVDQPAQVGPLVPASGGSVVVVTSRYRLSGLVMAGAVGVPLSPLAESEGVRVIGDAVGDDPEAAAELARLCGGLPIALRVCAARLAGRGHAARRLSRELADARRRLARLTAAGQPIVEAVFDAAYADLPDAAAALYRGMGAHPGPEFSWEVLEVIAGAAGVAGAGGDAASTIELLTEASLLEEFASPGTQDRFRMHDLVRAHAAARAGNLPEVTRTVVDWYLSRAKAADWAVFGRRLRLAEPTTPPAPPAPAAPAAAAAPPAPAAPAAAAVPPALPVPAAPRDAQPATPAEAGFGSPAEALAWLETERVNLVAAVREASGQGWDEAVWQFGEALWALFDNRRHPADELEVARLGVAAGRRLGNLPAEARMRNQVVRALLRAGEIAGAAEEAAAARKVAAGCGHRRIESAVIESYGLVRMAQGDHEAATEAFEAARTINAELGNPRGVALQSYHIGLALSAAGRHEEAVAEFDRAMEIATDIGDELTQAKIGTRLGAACLALGRRDQAASALLRALELLADRDMPGREATALDLLAEAAAEGQDAEALRERARSLRATPAPGAAEDSPTG